MGTSSPRLKERNMPKCVHLLLPAILHARSLTCLGIYTTLSRWMAPRALAEQGAGLSGPATGIFCCCHLLMATGHGQQHLSPATVHAALPSRLKVPPPSLHMLRLCHKDITP